MCGQKRNEPICIFIFLAQINELQSNESGQDFAAVEPPGEHEGARGLCQSGGALH